MVQPHTPRANALLRFMEGTIPVPIRGKKLSRTNLERLTRFVSPEKQASHIKQANKLSSAPSGQSAPRRKGRTGTVRGALKRHKD